MRLGFEAVERGQVICVTGRVNRTIALLVRMMPRAIVEGVGKRMGRQYRKT